MELRETYGNATKELVTDKSDNDSSKEKKMNLGAKGRSILVLKPAECAGKREKGVFSNKLEEVEQHQQRKQGKAT